LVDYILENVLVEGDILLYADCGCTLKPTGLPRLFNYLVAAMNAPNGILAFELSYPEKKYTKMDAIVGLNAAHLADTKQIMATDIILCKKARTCEVIRRWRDACANYHYIDDSPSLIPNADIFVENRHDQSLYSLVLKLDGGATLLGEETEINAPDYPIWNSRIKDAV
jgi:hypothetical protein